MSVRREPGALRRYGPALAAAFLAGLLVATIAASQHHPLWLLAPLGALLLGWALVSLWRQRGEARTDAAAHRQLANAFAEAIPLVAIRLDRTGQVLDANRACCLLLDREVEDILGRDWFTLAFPESERTQARTLFERSFGPDVDLHAEIDRFENTIVGADGMRRLVEWSAVPLVDAHGDRDALLCVGRDTTDEQAAQEEAARARAEIDALRRLAQKIAALDDARRAVVDATLELTGATFAGIAEPDRQGTKLSYAVATNPEIVGLAIDLATESSLVGQAFLSGRTVFSPDITAEPTRHPSITPLLQSTTLVHQPIVGAAGTVGVMTVGWAQPLTGPQDHALELVRLVSHEAAIALRRRESLAALERAALIDPLTSVANRRAFDAELPVALRRAGDTGEQLSLVVLDLNRFKEVNDLEGHEAGDDVLIRCTAAWIDVLRAGDLLARLGGDEFAVLLPTCDELEMREVMRRLRAATPHGPGAAVGGACWDGVESGAQLVRRADDAQYRDKALGRDPQLPPPAQRSPIDPHAPREDPRTEPH